MLIKFQNSLSTLTSTEAIIMMTAASETLDIATRNPSETSALWPTARGDGGSSSSSSEPQCCSWSNWKPRLLTITMVGLVVAVGANLLYDDFIHNPVAVEQRLIRKYERVANRSMELLNDLSNHDNDTANPVVGCESTVLIVRHCEDLGGHVRYEDGSSHCSYLGFQRSLYLATLFGGGGGGDTASNHTTSTTTTATTAPRWPSPAKLYGLWNQDGTNKRQYEVLRPLSDKTGVPIEMYTFDTAAEDLRDTLFELLRTGQFCHQIAVVAWKHKFIRPLAATLGCDQEKGCPGGTVNNEAAWGDYDFDTVWELQYVYQPEALRAYPQDQNVHHHNQQRLVDGWKVFGSVTHEAFDALAFKQKYYGAADGHTEEAATAENWMDHHDGHARD